MRIIFVRHGHPDYANDCLTELGKKQAEACAEKLVGEGISEIHSSSNGRALETASYSAKKLGLDIESHNFMREVRWGYLDEGCELIDDGHPWNTAEVISCEADFDIAKDNWRSHKYFQGNKVTGSADAVGEGLADWLSGFGYSFLSDGRLYCEDGSDKVVAVFSHGGSGAAMLAKLFNMPFPYACLIFAMNFTSISVIDIPNNKNSIVLPRIRRLNDDRHISTEKLTFEM